MLNRGPGGLALMLFFAFAARGFAATFTASLDRNTIALGDQVVLTLRFEGGQPQQISQPKLGGLRMASAVNQGSSISIANGVQTSVFTYTVALEPVSTGTFTIPSISAKVGGQVLTSQPITLKVIASDPTAPPADYANRMAFLWVALPKTNLFLNEPVVAEFRIYLRSDVHRYDNPQNFSPEGNGLTFGKIVEGQQYSRRVGGTSFTVVPLSVAVTPVKTGTLSINPINATIVLNNRDPMDFGGFFDAPAQPVRATLTSPRTDLNVSPLPTDHVPPGFNGAVGNYTMTVTAGPTNVVAGDPVTLRIQISGQGALDSLALPDMPGWENFKRFPPTSKVNATDQLGIEGSKTFEQIVTPENSDIKSLPPVTFSFFDPEQKKFRTLTHPATPLIVRAAAPGVMPAAVAAHSENSQPTADILPIKQHIGTLAEISPPLIRQPWFLILQGVPVFALLSSITWRKRKEALANNPRLRRKLHVEKVVREGLGELQGMAAQNKSDEFFATLFRLLQEQLGERLDLPASSITEAVIDERLRPARVSEELLGSLHELFQTCNLARYAPIKSSQELAAIIPKLEAALKQLREVKA
ncbi:MAG TPA: BatD family protein [Candidatus Angelobacter sp.]|nr:BatD family protein [Candidatus Angelobacter sp.]